MVGCQILIYSNHGLSFAQRGSGMVKIRFMPISVNKKDLTDDTRVVKKMIEVINKADIIVGHNVAAFDLKKINTRALKHRLTSFNPCQVVDTLKVARKEFLLHANSLDAIAKFLGVGRKQDTTRGLWQRIAMGDHTALKEMVEYNKNDVAIQEKVYEEMLPYITNHPNLNVIMESEDLICTNCGSDKVHRNGYRTTRAGKYARYRCQCCGAGFRAKKLIKTFDGR